MKTDEIISKAERYLLQTYIRPPIVLERGNGVNLFCHDGERYLDFMSGIGVNAFGYGDFDILEAISKQSGQLIHCSNLYYTIPQVELAELLIENSFADRVFFCNSGAEAVEACIKFTRKWGSENFSPPRYQIISMSNSFHGRTYGALSATGQEKFHKGFEPLSPGFSYAEFNNLDSVEKLITDRTCAIMVEPVQGEGGVNAAEPEFLNGLREICNRRDLLLIFDEVQFGLARSGSLFAYQHYGVEPDLMSLAKPLGGGLPIGAALTRQKVADALKPGDHASTFGGNPVVCAVGARVMRKLMAPGFIESVKATGDYLHSRLHQFKKRHSEVKEVRGFGLIAGVVTEYDPKAISKEFLKRKVLICTSGVDAVRMIPPLIIDKEQIDEVIDIFDEILTQGIDRV